MMLLNLLLPFLALITPTQAGCSLACSSLVGQSFSNGSAIVVFAEQLLNGSTFVGTSANAGYNTPQVAVPQACRIGLTFATSKNSSAQAELWLPAGSQWNSRVLTVGNSGWAGAVNYPDVVWGLRKGFATVSTNTGHNSSSSDGSFLSDPDQAINWGHRALHLSVMAAKEVVLAHYGKSSSYSYYAGCSTGGRQGLNAAERYPADFDGVLSGSAIPWQTHTASWQIYVALQQYPATRSSYIPTTKWPFIAAAVLEQCDGLDGVADGIIMDPSKCEVDIDALQCDAGTLNATACLTDDQAVNLARMYAPWLRNGTVGALVNPGISPSGEATFSYLMNGEEPQFGPTFYRYGVHNDTSWDFTTLTVADVVLADSINPGGANAYNPDLRPFQSRGGKVIQYHGYSDPLIPSLNAPAWHNTVEDFYRSLGKSNEVQDFYRLFMVPGMGHCSSGAGAWVIDGASQGGIEPPVTDSNYSMLLSLVDWVEGGTSAAPERVIGTKYVGDVAPLVQFTRPVCRWPHVAKYNGLGDVANADSWSCPTART
ncbi:hypothetical protein JX265_007740 [Neoarthrinium moseri]|uniref:Carboxylic ester hydrolase n=1 Tax=Neoarthrinium moseri TaxID=1658444 RepID=A0A9Q0AMU5_9PEZI|nr:hypothetical protein JX265_007740 [Neoarthrinium moseri]